MCKFLQRVQLALSVRPLVARPGLSRAPATADVPRRRTAPAWLKGDALAHRRSWQYRRQSTRRELIVWGPGSHDRRSPAGCARAHLAIVAPAPETLVLVETAGSFLAVSLAFPAAAAGPSWNGGYAKCSLI